MPATPAWPPRSLPRLFVDQPLVPGAEVPIEAAAANYLLAVLRMKPGDALLLFDDRTGEWRATVAEASKRRAVLAVGEQVRPREPAADLWLLVAPVKKGRIDLVAEKACELGVTRIRPVMTERTVIDRLNLDRLRAHMIEAAEQCGRTALPALDAPARLAALLAGWPAERALFFADETGGAPFIETAVAHRGPAAILIGPEGGFTPAERDAIRALPQAQAVSLGPRILRAETAAIAAVALWMAAAGDWRDPRPAAPSPAPAPASDTPAPRSASAAG